MEPPRGGKGIRQPQPQPNNKQPKQASTACFRVTGARAPLQELTGTCPLFTIHNFDNWKRTENAKNFLLSF
jgi:hypothetical protein